MGRAARTDRSGMTADTHVETPQGCRGRCSGAAAASPSHHPPASRSLGPSTGFLQPSAGASSTSGRPPLVESRVPLDRHEREHEGLSFWQSGLLCRGRTTTVMSGRVGTLVVDRGVI